MVDPKVLYDAFLLPSSLANGFRSSDLPTNAGSGEDQKPLTNVDDVLPSVYTIYSPESISISGFCDIYFDLFYIK